LPESIALQWNHILSKIKATHWATHVHATRQHFGFKLKKIISWHQYFFLPPDCKSVLISATKNINPILLGLAMPYDK
jgi:hypothetical protein